MSVPNLEATRREFMAGVAGAAAAIYGAGGAIEAVGAVVEESYWTLEQCKQAYLDYLGTKRDEILEQQDSRRYRHSVQWTSQQVKVFNDRKRPVVTFNRIGRKINAIVGLVEKLKQDPKAYPNLPRDDAGAELSTAAIRSVTEGELREAIIPFCAGDAAVDGIGGVEVNLIRGDHGDPEISFSRVHPDGFFYDPTSFEVDFADAEYMGQGKWLSASKIKRLFPDQVGEIDAELVSGWDMTSNSDREQKWFSSSGDRRRIRLVDIWYQHGDSWCWCMFTGNRKLAEGKTYLFNEKGEPISRYVMFSAFIDHDGDRYGFIRDLKSSQDEINQRRSKGIHELHSRRIIAEEGAFIDINQTRMESVRPDGIVIKQKGFEAEFDDQARIMNMEGQIKFLEDAKNEIENFGPNPALIGQGLEYKSGRAINLLQQAGLAELGPFTINFKNWKLRLYRVIWAAVQRYWTAERWLRISDDEGVAQFIQINGVGIDPRTGLPSMVNALGQLDVNIKLDEGPDQVNMMADSYDTLVALSAQGANIPPQVLLELAPLQSSVKKRLLAMMTQQDPVQEQMKQIAVAGASAEVDETKSKTALNVAKAQEAAQGGAHGVVERQMDMAHDQQKHDAKMQELAAKTRATAIQASQKVELGDLQSHQREVEGMQKLRQNEEQHRQKMRQQASKPKPSKRGNGRSSEVRR